MTAVFGDARKPPKFWKKIEVQPETGCWEWVPARAGGPYGPYRSLYESLVGKVQHGLQLDHVCRNTHCVNPGHMEQVTASENIRRMHKSRREMRSNPANVHIGFSGTPSMKKRLRALAVTKSEESIGRVTESDLLRAALNRFLDEEEARARQPS